MEKALIAVNAEEDYQAIRKAIDALNQGTMRLAELMMDTAVSSALKGKNHGRGGYGRRPNRPASHGESRIRMTFVILCVLLWLKIFD